MAEQLVLRTLYFPFANLSNLIGSEVKMFRLKFVSKFPDTLPKVRCFAHSIKN